MTLAILGLQWTPLPFFWDLTPGPKWLFAIDVSTKTSSCPKRLFPLPDSHQYSPRRLCGGTWNLRVIISSPLQWTDKLSKTSKRSSTLFLLAAHHSVFPLIPDKTENLSTPNDTFPISPCSHDSSGQCPSARKFQRCSKAYLRGGAWKKISGSLCFNRLPSRYWWELESFLPFPLFSSVSQ